MSSLRLNRAVVALAIGLFGSADSYAQIDHRVNQGNSAVAGRALDSNPGLGTGRFNLTRPGMSDPGAMSNAIISGNVTGLGGFKDYSPVPQSNQFRAPLPSSGLSSFQARSVGLPEVSSQRNLAPTFYFGTAETVTNAGQIQQGLNAPGSSQLRTPYTAPPRVQDVDPSSRELNALIRQPEDRRVNLINPTPPSASITQRPIVTSPLNGMNGSAGSAYGSAVGSSIFGTPLPPRSPAGGLPPDRTPAPELNPPWSGRTAPNGALESTKTDDFTGVNPRLQDDVGQPLNAGKTGKSPDEKTPDATRQQTVDRPSLPQSPPSGPLPTPDNLGADRFADLYNAVELAQRFGTRDLGFEIGKRADSKSGTATPESSPFKAMIRKPSEGLNQLATAAKWAKDIVDDPIRSFAGKYQDRLNQYMAAGEADLRIGRYYSAARLFDLAATIDPMNPLPLLARGHAYLAAGDYVSAEHSIEEGIRRFPQIAAFRIDLPGLVGQHDIFDIRRADLESKLASSENNELRFLLGYIELYSGLPEDGLKNLEKAAKAAPPDSIIAIFADLVLGRRELPKLGR